jgi:hypothetical protein
MQESEGCPAEEASRQSWCAGAGQLVHAQQPTHGTRCTRCTHDAHNTHDTHDTHDPHETHETHDTRHTRDTHDTHDTHETHETHETRDTRDTHDTHDTHVTHAQLLQNSKLALGVEVLARWVLIPVMSDSEKAAYMPAAFAHVEDLEVD